MFSFCIPTDWKRYIIEALKFVASRITKCWGIGGSTQVVTRRDWHQSFYHTDASHKPFKSDQNLTQRKYRTRGMFVSFIKHNRLTPLQFNQSHSIFYQTILIISTIQFIHACKSNAFPVTCRLQINLTILRKQKQTKNNCEQFLREEKKSNTVNKFVCVVPSYHLICWYISHAKLDYIGFVCACLRYRFTFFQRHFVNTTK